MTTNKVRVVCLDDEQTIIDAFDLYEIENVEIKSFTDPYECLKSLVETKPWIIISDQRMSKMPGHEFLVKTKELVPNAIRIMLTAYSDEIVPSFLINNNCADAYIKKPIDGNQLESVIKKYIDLYAERNVLNRYKNLFGSAE